MVVWVFAALGVDIVLEQLDRRLPAQRRRWILGALASALVLGTAAQALERTQTWHTPILEDYLVNTLESAPENEETFYEPQRQRLLFSDLIFSKLK